MEERAFNDISYEKFLREEKLMGSRCKGCGRLYVPPRPLCIECHGAEMEWVRMKGEGRLAAFTCITVPPPFMMAQGYNRKNPYCTGVVELAEGGRVDARIVGVDPTNPETIRVGMPLKVKFLHWEEDGKKETFLAFEPA
ncbi:MAG: Zn-ribbon domain-containing OB-fold protein [Deltaproteobacteria bacterium]|nr:Zn-ribbon domain-containing OB-fold protein [Deltaproteobacteria bacterium]MBW1924323.1 Zn-ribbon domain-containing OB-fold protein [Deltaproteobacteria bacterium]MBW1948462.1 Zn-ribbon domain-containing OB-fold protein [Deltaproteobacteria bacterium]MBW2009795.1 Zn-ribbon domain-containing OB-fold protein [Deltaproteobacteria bacterium]MBW2103941.1 Zn-ribbon domain-containing OB-fold protein [Deltaproteobacteria bacterium]